METIVINSSEPTKTKQIINYLNEIQVSFTVQKEEEKSYDPEFVERILKSKTQYKEGKFTTIKTEDLWK